MYTIELNNEMENYLFEELYTKDIYSICIGVQRRSSAIEVD